MKQGTWCSEKQENHIRRSHAGITGTKRPASARTPVRVEGEAPSRKRHRDRFGEIGNNLNATELEVANRFLSTMFPHA